MSITILESCRVRLHLRRACEWRTKIVSSQRLDRLNLLPKHHTLTRHRNVCKGTHGRFAMRMAGLSPAIQTSKAVRPEGLSKRGWSTIGMPHQQDICPLRLRIVWKKWLHKIRLMRLPSSWDFYAKKRSPQRSKYMVLWLCLRRKCFSSTSRSKNTTRNSDLRTVVSIVNSPTQST